MLSRYDSNILEANDAAASYFTGLSWNVYDSLCRYLVPFSKQPCQNLHLQNQITLFLVRCRLNLPLKYLSYQVSLSSSAIDATFHKILELMYYKLNCLISTKDRDHICKTILPVFMQYFQKHTNIFDCFEIFIEQPKNLNARAQFYSNYKKHSSVKYLISCSPTGAVTFLSPGYGGRATDIRIVRESGCISSKYHYPGDQLLADHGFALKEDFVAECSSELFIPAFIEGQKQLTAKEAETTRQIATARIHMERIIGVIKNRFRILDGPLPITFIKSLIDECGEDLLSTIDKLVTVCASVVNLSTGIVYSDCLWSLFVFSFFQENSEKYTLSLLVNL